MIRDKIVYMLSTRFPGVTEEIARKLKAAGIVDAPKMRAADAKLLKDAGMKQADIDKIKAAKK